MKLQRLLRMPVDLAMTLALFFLMGYQLWGEAAHEWAGAAILVLLCCHHLLNLRWYGALPKGRYSPLRALSTAVNFLLLGAMLLQLGSGMVMSRYVFDFLPISGGMAFARRLHILGAYWGFLLISLHLGLHWGMFLGMARKALKLRQPSRLRKVLLPILGAVIAVYGFTVFIRRDLLTYMFLQTEFVFLDFGESIPLFYFDYLTMMGTFIFLAYYISQLLRKIQPKKENA